MKNDTNTELIKPADLSKLYTPLPDSHKGQNGRLMVIGGSHLFHAASLWALTVASRIVDLVHYCSVPENNEVVSRARSEFRNGIVIPRPDLEEYIGEDDCVLIGPGMVRSDNSKINPPTGGQKSIRRPADKPPTQNLTEILNIKDEGQQTGVLTDYLLAKYPGKQWVIDAGALQMMDISLIPPNAILTPHEGEFDRLWEKHIAVQTSGSPVSTDKPKSGTGNDRSLYHRVGILSQTYNCIILLKGKTDIIGSPQKILNVTGGNAGMTKGGTGDVLAGLVAALACKNDPYLAAVSGSQINKTAGDELYNTVGPYFNATDLANRIPITMNNILKTGR